MKIPLALASAVMLAGTLAACTGDGGDDDGADSDYCKDIKKVASTYRDLSSGDLAELEQVTGMVDKLGAKAPDEVNDDWKALDAIMASAEKALKDAGLTFADLSKIQSGEVPEGVDVSKLQGVATELAKLGGADFTKAVTAIEAHAKKTCKVDLGAS